MAVRLSSFATLAVLLTADGKQFRSTLQKSKTEVSLWSKHVRRNAGLANTALLSIATYKLGGAALQGIKQWGEYEASLSDVAAKTGTTRRELEKLSLIVRESAEKSVYTARQTAEAATFLAQAGQNVYEIERAIDPVIKLAAATRHGIQETADIVTNIQQAIGIDVNNLSDVADVLALTTARSNVNMSDLSESFKYASATAHPLNLSLTELSASIGILGNVGIKGSLAGTAFRQALAALARTSEDAGDSAEGNTVNFSRQEQTLRDLGVSVYKAEGEFRNLLDILKDLSAAGATVPDFVKIFGSRAGSSLSILARNLGQVEELLTTLNSSAGSATEISRKQLQNLAGETKILKSAFGELQLAWGDSGAGEAQRDLTRLATVITRKATPAVVALGANLKTLVLILAPGLAFLAGALALKAIAALSSLAIVLAATPLGLIVLAILGVNAAILTMHGSYDKFFRRLEIGWKASVWVAKKYTIKIINFALTSWADFRNAINDALEIISLRARHVFETIQTLIHNMSQAAKDAWKTIKSLMSGDGIPDIDKSQYRAVEGEESFMQKHFRSSKIKPDLIPEIKPFILPPISSDPIKPATDNISKDYQKLADEIVDANEGLADKIAEAAKKIADTYDTAFDGIGARAQSVFSQVSGAFSKMIQLTQEGERDRIKDGRWSADTYRDLQVEAFDIILNHGAKNSKKLARLQKALAIGSAIRDVARGITSALGSAPPPWNFVTAGLVAAAGAIQIKTIRETPIGQAHGGMARIPRTGSYMLEEGERVVKARTNLALEKFLYDSNRAETSTAPNVVVNVHAIDTKDLMDRIAEPEVREGIASLVSDSRRRRLAPA